MTDKSVCESLEVQGLNNILDDNNTLHTIMKKMTYRASMFNCAETVFNNANTYYYGELPYKIQSKLFEIFYNNDENNLYMQFKLFSSLFKLQSEELKFNINLYKIKPYDFKDSNSILNTNNNKSLTDIINDKQQIQKYLDKLYNQQKLQQNLDKLYHKQQKLQQNLDKLYNDIQQKFQYDFGKHTKSDNLFDIQTQIQQKFQYLDKQNTKLKQKIINLIFKIIKYQIDLQITSQYINKEYGLDFTNTDINKIHVLIAYILCKMINKDNLCSKIIDTYKDLTLYYNIHTFFGDILTVDVNDKGEFTSRSIQKIIDNINAEIFSNMDRPQQIEKYIYSKVVDYLGINNKNGKITIKLNNINDPQYIIKLEQDIDVEYNKILEEVIQSYYVPISTDHYFNDTNMLNDETLFNITNTSIFNHNIFNKNILDNYYDTSMLIYTQHLIPPIKSNDDGNGRLSEFLLSTVYHDYGTKCYIRNNVLTETSNNNNKYYGIDNKYNYCVLNIRRLNYLYVNYFCKDGIFTKRHLYLNDPSCKLYFNRGYNLFADIYNKIHIDVDNILVKLDDQITKDSIEKLFNDLESNNTRNNIDNDLKIIHVLIDLINRFVIIFAPLQPLTQYYSNMENKSNDMNRLWYNKNLNIYSDTINVNNDSGGDLYCADAKNFYLLDSKRYNEFNDCYKMKTIIQSWMYMNVYMKPLCYIQDIRDKDNGIYKLYKDYYVGFVNPLRNELAVYNYNDISTKLNNAEYNQNENYSNYLQNDYIFANSNVNNVSEINEINEINKIKWDQLIADTKYINHQIEISNFDKSPADIKRLDNLFCRNDPSSMCNLYRKIIKNNYCSQKSQKYDSNMCEQYSKVHPKMQKSNTSIVNNRKRNYMEKNTNSQRKKEKLLNINFVMS